MNWLAIVNLIAQLAPEEVAILNAVVGAIHAGHQAGNPAVASAVLNALSAPAPTPAPVPVVAQSGNQAVADPQQPVTTNAQPSPVVVTGVPGVKRNRDLVNVATPRAN